MNCLTLTKHAHYRQAQRKPASLTYERGDVKISSVLITLGKRTKLTFQKKENVKAFFLKLDLQLASVYSLIKSCLA